jgi:hypothetical protein
LGAEIERRDHKDGLGLRIWHVDDAQIPTAARLANRHAGAFASGTILKRPTEDILDFRLVDLMPVNVRRIGLGINIEAEIHVLPTSSMRAPA